MTHEEFCEKMRSWKKKTEPKVKDVHSYTEAELELKAELERKFDELFGPLNDEEE